MDKDKEARLEELEQFLTDACAYLQFLNWKTSPNIPAHDILASIGKTFVHDITGLKNREVCFKPRVDGYAQFCEKKGIPK